MPNVVRRDPAQLGFLKYLLKDAPSPIVLVEWLSLFIDINPAKLDCSLASLYVREPNSSELE